MITKEGAEELFGAANCHYISHPKKSYIVKHIVDKSGLDVTPVRVEQCIKKIKSGALFKIKELKRQQVGSDLEKYRAGILFTVILMYQSALLSI